MSPNGKNIFLSLAAITLLACGSVSIARAEDGEGDCDRPTSADTVRMVLAEERFWQECAICHIGYPPRMLPTQSWRNIMAGLERHFGMDASLPAKDIEEITFYLAENSTDCWGVELVPLRITSTDWFRRRHNSYVIPPDIWLSRAVRTPANCPACHGNARSGHYSERTVRLPQ